MCGQISKGTSFSLVNKALIHDSAFFLCLGWCPSAPVTMFNRNARGSCWHIHTYTQDYVYNSIHCPLILKLTNTYWTIEVHTKKYMSLIFIHSVACMKFSKCSSAIKCPDTMSQKQKKKIVSSKLTLGSLLLTICKRGFVHFNNILCFYLGLSFINILILWNYLELCAYCNLIHLIYRTYEDFKMQYVTIKYYW